MGGTRTAGRRRRQAVLALVTGAAVAALVAPAGAFGGTGSTGRVLPPDAGHHDPHLNHFVVAADRLAAAAPASTDPAQVGQWAAPFSLGVTSIHTVQLPGGRVLFFDTSATAGGRGKVWNPATGALTPAPVGFKADVFCSAHTVLADGRVFTAGGHLYGTGGTGKGSRDTALFNPATGQWTAGPLLVRARWYPTVVTRQDGKVLIFGGQTDKDTQITDVELYNPATNTVSQLPATANRLLKLYPRMHLTPDGKVWMTGPATTTAVFDPVRQTWRAGPAMKGGDRTAGGSVLLPGNRRVLAFGGGGTTGKSSAEILDTAAATPTWRSVGSMTYARKQLSPVLLPDGAVLAVGGGAGPGLYDNPVRVAERWDPVTEQWTVMAAQVASRMYHSTAILLSDGRVLSSGQTNGPYADYGEVYSPPYLFRGARPVINDAPTEMTYGQQVAVPVTTPSTKPVGSVMLIKQASQTHVTGFDQSAARLAFTSTPTGTGAALTVTAPSGPAEAMRGWYMMFVVDAAGVPSVARWVHLS